MKILQVAACPFPADHGTPGAIRELVNCLANYNYEIHIVTYPIKRDLYLHPQIKVHRIGKEKSVNIKVGPFLQRFLYDVLLPFKIKRIVKNYFINLIHAHNYESLLAVLMAKNFQNFPSVIYNAINLMEEELPTYRFIPLKKLSVLIGRFLDTKFPVKADFIIANTERLKNFFISLNYPKERIEVVPTGIDETIVKGGNGEKIRKKLKLFNKKIILYTGTFDRFQGLDILISAFEDIVKVESNVMLLLAGGVVSKEQKKYYTSLIEKKGLKNHVIFKIVSLNELKDYLASCDITVCPRVSSAGMPVKILNYLAAKKPVVTFKGAAPFLTQEEALLIDSPTPKALAEGIIKVLKDKKLAKNIATQGLRKLKKEFTIEVVTKRVMNVYKKVLEMKKCTI